MFKWRHQFKEALYEQLFCPVPEKYRELFADSCFRLNLARLPVLCLAAMIATLVAGVVQIESIHEDSGRLIRNLLVFGLHFVFMTVFFVLTLYYNQRGARRRSLPYRFLVPVFSVVYLFGEFSILCATIDRDSAFLRFVAILFLVLGLPLRPRMQSFAIAMATGASFYAAMPLFPPLRRMLMINSVLNVFIMLVSALSIAFLSYSAYVNTFVSRSRVSEANDHLLGLNQELQRLSHTDQLTGVGNRRAFEEKLALAWTRCAALGEPLSVLMLDVDFFKTYNDHFTHPIGDKCLVSLAHRMRDLLHRRSDIVCRYGGEEFVVILPETDLATARLLAERIRTGIESLHIPAPPTVTGPFVTVSLGAASCVPPEGESPQHLVDRADKAMYISKQKGRNRVTILE